MRELKQSSTAQPLLFLLIDSTDHLTGKTGLSPTVTLSKNGGSFAGPSGAVTEIANGWYKVAGNATDTGTLGPLILHATGTGADPVDVEYGVVAFDPQSATNLGLSGIPTATPGASGGLVICGSNAATTFATLTVTGNMTVNGLSNIVRVGTAQSGTGGGITLDSGASAVNNFYANRYIGITSGTGAGQPVVLCAGYDGTSKVATIRSNFVVAPDNTSVFVIYGQSQADIVMIQGGTDAVDGLSSMGTDYQGDGAINVILPVNPPTDWLNAASIKADAVTKMQSGLATPTNITAGTITTVTNLTNAPTVGDFTSTMKTSLNSATPSVTVSDKTGFVLSGTQNFNNTGNWIGNVSGVLSTLTTYTGNTPQTGDSYAIVNNGTYGNAQLARATTVGVPMQSGVSVVLASSQPNYAPSKQGDKMDLIDSPNSVAISAISASGWTYTTRTLTSQGDSAGVGTLLTRISQVVQYDGSGFIKSTPQTDVNLASIQPHYAPSKAGDIMSLGSGTIYSIQSGIALQSTLLLVPTNTLLSNDSRLNNIDVAISTRASSGIAPSWYLSTSGLATEVNATNNKNAIISHGDANWESGGGGGGFTGSISCTFIFHNANGDPVSNTIFTVKNTATDGANASGTFTGGLNPGTYIMSATPAGGNLWADTTFDVESSPASQTFTFTSTSVPVPTPSDDPGSCIIYDTARGIDNSIKDGVIYTVQVIGRQTGGSYETINGKQFSVRSNGTSVNNISFTLQRGLSVQIARGTSSFSSNPNSATFTVPDQGSAQLGDIIDKNVLGPDMNAP